MKYISVVIPLYNKIGHVKRAIDSVLSQTYKDFEIIVVDDGSTDDGVAVVRGMTDSRIRLIEQSNAGVSAARNTGIHAATSDLVAFLDADDAYCPDFLENICRMRELHPEAAAYAMNYQIVAPDGRVGLGLQNCSDSPELLSTREFLRMAIVTSPVHSSSVAAPKNLLLKIGGFPVGVKLGEDIDTWLRLTFEGNIVYSYRAGGIYHLDAEARSCIINPPPDSYIFFDTIDRWALTQSLTSSELSDIVEFKNFFIIIYAIYQIRRGDISKGRAALLSCRTKKFLLKRMGFIFISLFPRKHVDFLVHVKNELKALKLHVV